ncbi:MAG: MobA/MobL family protein [Oscillospiraceae bacterium]|jgi:DNA invertase Pin-like site-specific DNA recombinase|nr:MobA/MobL family protein [Oscillospiraceae bacterium]
MSRSSAKARVGSDLIASAIQHDLKFGLAYSEILLPDNAPREIADHQALWNTVEEIERNRNAQTAREIEFSLPVELTSEEQISLARDYVQREFVACEMCADLNIHNKRNGNPHCHVLLTMRPLERDGTWGAKSRREYILDRRGERIPLASGDYKSRKVPATDWDSRENAEHWREAWAVTVNIRLSIEDKKTESLSIENQHMILDCRIDDLDIPNARILNFVDNGHTGVNMERPAVQEMLDLVRSGGVNLILIKDFSRFSRNAMDSGYFIEQVFPLYQVRFISVSDNFNSEDYLGDTGGIDVAFKFLMYEYYSADLSAKMKSAKRLQMKRGENIVARAAYGYYKAESGK